MKLNKLNSVVFLGLLAIVGVLVMQLLTLSKAYDFEKKELHDKIHFALLDVVKKIYSDNKKDLPITNQVQKVSEDYYIVNVNDVFEATILETYLKNEFSKVQLNTDFEYAIYDCSSDKMVYGNYIGNKKSDIKNCTDCFPKNEGYTYYFAVRFPLIKYSYVSSLQNYWIYTIILVLILIIYVYTVVMFLKQKKYTLLQNDFINNMTHEFKTPLSSILIASKFIKDQNAIKTDTKLNKYTQIIIAQSEKLNQHIERILAVAKTDTKWIELDKSNLNLVETLELIEENCKLKTSKQLLVKCEIESTIMLFCDTFHIYNVFYNIFDNAIKYCENNPIKILVALHKNDKEAVLSFTDNGVGIKKSELNFVFDKFYRVPRENKKDIEGFGIGLFYVNKIIALHHWKIAIQNNTTEQGITVSIYIPLKDVYNNISLQQ